MVRWILVLIVVLVVGFFGYVKLNNHMPEGLGVTNGQLKACPESPNCVSTQADPADEEHYAEPVVYLGARKDMQLRIEALMLELGQKWSKIPLVTHILK